MIERAIEYWLDNTNERSMQAPFCFMLAHENHTNIHSTRHAPLELGVDVISINEKNIPCLYQLKCGNITLRKWNDILPQITNLIYDKPLHPSLSKFDTHDSFLVTNGIIEEEAMVAISQFNAEAQRRGFSPLQFWTRGQLFKMAQNLGSQLWPSELKDIRSLLDLILCNGCGLLQKEKLFTILESTYSLNDEVGLKNISLKEAKRMLASNALLTAIAVKSFSEAKNYIAVSEAWIINCITTFRFSRLLNLGESMFRPYINLSWEAIQNNLFDLADEILTDSIKELHGPSGPIFNPIRALLAKAYLSALGLQICKTGRRGDANYCKIVESINAYDYTPFIWGEGGIPMYLGIFWFQNRMDASLRPEIDILRLFAGFVTAKGSASRMLRHEPFMPSSYYQIDEVLEYLLDNCISKHAKTVPYRLAPEPLNDDFQYRSQFAESLLYMLVRRRWKQHVKYLWPFYTRIAKEDFIIENSDDFFSWRCKNVRSITQQVKRKADWGDLLKFAEEIDIKSVPFELREDPILLLLILYVMPHRASTELISWLDYEINRIPWW